MTTECDIFTGQWIRDPSGPFYTNESCPFIESHQNCMKNGRPDSEYFYWRWKPRDCELPKFDPRRFLDSMRDKSWAFVGDSISRNHVQSLLCSLSQVKTLTQYILFLEFGFDSCLLIPLFLCSIYPHIHLLHIFARRMCMKDQFVLLDLFPEV